MAFTNILFHSVACLFILLKMSFTAELLNFNEVQPISSWYLKVKVFGVVSQKPFLNPRLSRYSPMLSSSGLIALYFAFRPVIHFELFL